MTEQTNTNNWFIEKCRENGLKVTPQRIEIYKSLCDSDDHPSAELICRRVRRSYPGISLDTVNRTLLKLSQIGLAFIVEGTGEARRFDAEMDNHQHLRCVKCRKIIDFHYEPFDSIELPAGIGDGFSVRRSTVYFEGVCEQCTAAGMME